MELNFQTFPIRVGHKSSINTCFRKVLSGVAYLWIQHFCFVYTLLFQLIRQRVFRAHNFWAMIIKPNLMNVYFHLWKLEWFLHHFRMNTKENIVSFLYRSHQITRAVGDVWFSTKMKYFQFIISSTKKIWIDFEKKEVKNPKRKDIPCRIIFNPKYSIWMVFFLFALIVAKSCSLILFENGISIRTHI